MHERVHPPCGVGGEPRYHAKPAAGEREPGVPDPAARLGSGEDADRRTKAIRTRQSAHREHGGVPSIRGATNYQTCWIDPEHKKGDPRRRRCSRGDRVSVCVDSGCRVEHGQFALAIGPEPRSPFSLRAGPTNRLRRGHPSQARMPILVSGSTVRPGAHAVITSSSARCLIVVSSNERCTWLVRVVYRRP